MMAMDWQMTLIAFIAVPLVVVALLPIMQQSRKIGRNHQDELANFSSDSTSVLSEIILVKSSNGEPKELNVGSNRISSLYDIGVKKAFINSLTQPIINMMMLLFLGILGYGAIRVMNGSLTMGALVSFLMNLFQIMSPVIIISQFFNELSKTSGSTQRINEPEEIAQDKQNVDITNKELKFEHIDFSYEDGKPNLTRSLLLPALQEAANLLFFH